MLRRSGMVGLLGRERDKLFAMAAGGEGGEAVVEEIPLSPLDERTVVVRTRYSAISTGTEMKVFKGLSGHLGGALWYPLVPGYEEVG